MAKRKAVRSPRKVLKMAEEMPEVANMEETENMAAASPLKMVSPKLLAVLVVLAVVLFLLVWKNKGLVVAAMVDSRPIWRWDLEQKLDSRYGSQTLTDLINRQIIKNEADKQGVSVSEGDVDNKIRELTKTLPAGMTLADALAQQGTTMADFRNDVKTQLMVEKLAAASIVVTDAEVASFAGENKAMLTATDAAGIDKQARDALIRQKTNQEFQKMFADLKKKAKVVQYF